MSDFLVEIPASVIASLSPDEWQCVCEQLDELDDMYYETTIGGRTIHVLMFEKALTNLEQILGLPLWSDD